MASIGCMGGTESGLCCKKVYILSGRAPQTNTHRFVCIKVVENGQYPVDDHFLGRRDCVKPAIE